MTRPIEVDIFGNNYEQDQDFWHARKKKKKPSDEADPREWEI